MEFSPNVQSLNAPVIELGNINFACAFCQLRGKWCVAELRMKTAAAVTGMSALALQWLKSLLQIKKSFLLDEKKKTW